MRAPLQDTSNLPQNRDNVKGTDFQNNNNNDVQKPNQVSSNNQIPSDSNNNLSYKSGLWK